MTIIPESPFMSSAASVADPAAAPLPAPASVAAAERIEASRSQREMAASLSSALVEERLLTNNISEIFRLSETSHFVLDETAFMAAIEDIPLFLRAI